jgi:hypothetical protein
MVLILTASYDKSGFGIDRTSVSVYKSVLIAVLGLYVIDRLVRPVKQRVALNGHVYRWLVIFVVVQTIASLLGETVGPLPVSLPSEMYYLLQRSSFLIIPLLALRYKVHPRLLLRWFVASVLIHGAFIALQFASPGTYAAFGRMVSGPMRIDNTVQWTGETLDFIGLQRTSNYGSFVAAFGLLALGLEPRRRIGRVLCAGAAVLAALVVTLGPSRASLIMAVVALFVWAYRTGWFLRTSTYAKLALAACLAAALTLAQGVPTKLPASVNAFVDPEREGSNLGKLAIAEMGIQLSRQSPVVGYGQRRFADLTFPLGNDSTFTSEAHSHVLSILLSSGLVGLLANVAVWWVIVRALWRRRDSGHAIVCGMFIGLGFYSVIYDAGGLDLFACYNGLAAYYAVTTVPWVRTVPDVLRFRRRRVVRQAGPVGTKETVGACA